MIKGLTLEQLADKIMAERTAKRDYIVNTRALKFLPKGTNGALSFATKDGDVEFSVNDHALKQIAAHYSIPMPYVDKMRNGVTDEKKNRILVPSSLELLAHNVNHWLSLQPSKRMIRCFQGLGPEPTVRAFLSDAFRPLDYFDLAEAILPYLMQAGVDIKSCQITDTKLYIQAVSTSLSKELRPGATMRDVGGSMTQVRPKTSVLHPGVVISNSEVGDGSCRVDPMLYNTLCANGMVSSFSLRQNHVGRRNGGNGDNLNEAREFFSDETREADDKALWLKVRDTVKASFEEALFERMASQFEASMDVNLGDDVNLVTEVTANRFKLDETEKTGILGQLMSAKNDDGNISQFDVVNAITRMAQDAKSYDRAIDLERLGGTALELKRQDFLRNSNN